MIFVVGLIFYVCCCNDENLRNPTVTALETRSTDLTARTYQRTVNERIIREFIFYERTTVLLKTRPTGPKPTPTHIIYMTNCMCNGLICRFASALLHDTD